MDNEEERMRKDPNNWRGLVYYNPRDPRLFVPKRIPWLGWTLNFAHREAKWIMILITLAFILVAVYSYRS